MRYESEWLCTCKRCGVSRFELDLINHQCKERQMNEKRKIQQTPGHGGENGRQEIEHKNWGWQRVYGHLKKALPCRR